MALREVTYDFYADSYGGTAIDPEQWDGLSRRAAYRLERIKALSKVTPLGDEDECESMAICAMADAYQTLDETAAGGVSSEAIGSVHVTYGDVSRVAPQGTTAYLLDSIKPYLHVCMVVA